MASLQQILNILLAPHKGPGIFTPLGNGQAGHRAAAESELRYLPALQALVATGQAGTQQYHTDVRAARRGGAATAQAIGNIANQFQTQIHDLPSLSEKAYQNLGLTREAVGGELARMQANQVAGINSSVASLGTKHRDDWMQVAQQLGQTAQQAGLYNSGQYDALAADARKARTQQKQFEQSQTAGLLKAGFDSSGNPLPGIFNRLHPKKTPTVNKYGRTNAEWAALSDGQRKQIIKGYSTASSGGSNAPKTAPGVTRLTQSQHNTFRREVLAARHWAQSFLQNGTNRHDAAQVLLTGAKGANGTKIPAFDQDTVRTALDLTYRHGFVSKDTARMLNHQGYAVKGLGFKIGQPKRHKTQAPAGFRPGDQPSVQIGS